MHAAQGCLRRTAFSTTCSTPAFSFRISKRSAPLPVNCLAGPWPESLANHSTASVIRAGLNRFGSLPPQLADVPSGGRGGIDAAELPLRELDLSYNNLTVGGHGSWLGRLCALCVAPPPCELCCVAAA